ncbi:MAG: peptidyl-prolyl cis-trans isomerase, partial [Armatimonadetes bacterium]|nr:peptidyl-prolyl cis-trans isomerase [Armatimonadota bacterium]
MRTIWRPLAAMLAATALLTVLGCSNQPIAIVNGSRVTKKEFYDRLEQAGGERVLADLIARQLLADAFNKSGLKVTEQEITAEIEKMKKEAPNEAEWQGYLKQQGMNEADFRDFVTFNLKVKKMAEKDVKVDEAALRKFFAENRTRFARPETVRLSEIVVNDKAQADKIRGQLKDAAQFPTLARQYSISTYTRERGGMRPEEPLVGIQPEAVRKAVLGLQVGQVSQPIKADSVWYIIKLEQRNAAQKADYDKIKDVVREQYMATHAKTVQDMIEGLRKTARVRILSPKYEEMNRMFGPPQALPSFGEQKDGKPAA